MQACGNACGVSFGWTSTNVQTLPHSHYVSEGWDSVVLGVPELQLIGASWADCLPMIHARHPDVAAQLLGHLEGHPETPCLQEAAALLRSLDGVMGFEPPAWRAVLAGARPPPIPEEFEPSQRGFVTC